MSQVVVVGSANVDLVVPVERVPTAGETVLAVGDEARHAGGKGLNQAVAAARAGADVAMVAGVGDDEAGAWLRRLLDDEGVDTAAVATHADHRTGTARITVQTDGDNAIVVVPGANAAAEGLGARGRDAVRSAAVVLAQLEVPAPVVAEAGRLARAGGARFLLNAAPATADAAALVPLADVLLVNETEAAALAGTADPAAAARALAAGGRDVVVTLGARGALLVTSGGEEHRVAAPTSRAVDTTGAGDAAAGTLAAALAHGEPVPSAVRRACAAGALAVRVAGAVPSLPTRQAVDALLAGGPG